VHESREVYAFDQLKANILNTIPASTPGEDLKVFSYIKDPWYKEIALRQFWLDSILLGLSVIAKPAEFFVQWKYGDRLLALIALSSWLFFFIAALMLHLHSLRKHKQTLEVDTLAGSLPTCSTSGGSRKVVLGVPKSGRQHFIWKIVWALSAIASVLTVISTYLALGRSEGMQVFFIWVGFQIIWLGTRLAIYYLLSDREMQYTVSVEGKPWPKVNPQERARVSRLVLALSKYQQHLHSRTILSYMDDIDAISKLPRTALSFPLPPNNHESFTISVKGIIADTLLASAAWTFGSKRGGFDFYDTCVILLNTNQGELAVPAARALFGSGKPLLHRTDSEWGFQVPHLPRVGMGAQGNRPLGFSDGMRWCYWVPCASGYWLYFTTPQTKKTGTREASVLSDDQVTDVLARGELFISLKHVDEVKEIIENSRLAYAYLVELFR
jgi:hypothetical protein